MSNMTAAIEALRIVCLLQPAAQAWMEGEEFRFPDDF